MTRCSQQSLFFPAPARCLNIWNIWPSHQCIPIPRCAPFRFLLTLKPKNVRGQNTNPKTTTKIWFGFYFVFKELETFCVSLWEEKLIREFQNSLCSLKSSTQMPTKLTEKITSSLHFSLVLIVTFCWYKFDRTLYKVVKDKSRRVYHTSAHNNSALNFSSPEWESRRSVKVHVANS